jgi:Arc/MetJ-type ribon-helix-helix transcriptional regulator
MEERIEIFSFRLPVSTRGMMRKFVEMDTHMSESDLVRNAIREYIENRIGKEAAFKLLSETPNCTD